MAAAAVADGMDPRIVYVVQKLSKHFDGVGADKLKKVINEADSSERLLSLLNGDSRVLVYVEAGGVLSTSAGLPRRMPKGANKMLLILRVCAGSVEHPTSQLVVQELLANEPLEHLERVLALYLPLLSNPAAGYGEVATRAVVDELARLQAAVAITVSATRGEPCLPLPPLSAATDFALKDKEVVHLLEGAVITWTRQIKAVLRMDPEAQLKAGGHPTPDSELAFWRTKAAHLNAIFDQLQSERVRRVLMLLDADGSTYCDPFAKLCKELFGARAEANDNVRFLTTLEPWLKELTEADDVTKLAPLYRPIMHTLLLIWKNSRFYNTPTRLVTLVRQICNAIIAACGRDLTGPTVFEMIRSDPPKPAVERLRVLLKVAGDFKKAFLRYKANAAAECPANPWRISNAALFLRLDAYIERATAVADAASVILQFGKLEKVIIGGSKGGALTASVEAIRADFIAAVDAFQAVTYDILDPEQRAFAEDAAVFKGRVRELERRLAAVLLTAFEDATTLQARFKLLDLFDLLLERPAIADNIERLHVALVADYARDVRRVQELFLSQRAAPPIASNLPPIAGALAWCRGLRDRVSESLPRVRGLAKEVLAREETKEALKLASSLVAAMEEFEAARVDEWGADLERSSTEKLALPLLTARGNLGTAAAAAVPPVDAGAAAGGPVSSITLLEVNFDPSLVRLLREVKYFLLLGMEVPPSALEVFKKAETYRRQTSSLDLVVDMHNTILTEMLPVEAPLLRALLNKMESVLARGIRELNWRSPGVDAFIAEATNSVKAAHEMLFSLKSNLRDMVTDMEAWSKEPLLQRKSKPMTPDEFEGTYRTARAARYAAIGDGKALKSKLELALTAHKINRTSKEWVAYVDFANGIVVQGISRLVVMSLRKLVDLLSPEKIKRAQELPMLIIDLALPGGKALRFVPDVHESDSPAGPPSLYDMVNGWVDGFYEVARKIKRLDGDGNYMKEIVDDLEVQSLLAQLADTLARSEALCAEFRRSYEAYSFLWESDQHTVFEAFLAGAQVELPRTEEQKKVEAEAGEAPPQPLIPNLAKFEAEIRRYTEIGEAIAALKTPTDIGWLRVNSHPVKYALQQLVSSWIGLFTTYLKKFVEGSVEENGEFMRSTLTGLEEEVTPEDPEPLKRCMGFIRQVKLTRFTRKAKVAPLSAAVSMLKRNGVSLEDHSVDVGGNKSLPVPEFLAQAELRLDAVINKTADKKEQIFPLQTAAVARIREESTTFEDRVRAFWNNFRKTAPFSFTGPVDEAYSQLDGYYRELTALEAGAVALNEEEELFELPVARFNEFGQCRAQLKALKALWDFRALVLLTHDAWKAFLWNDINSDALDTDNKKLGAELKRLGDSNGQARAWGVFKDSEAQVRDMSVTLPIIKELHSPAMRPRHWEQLAELCGVKQINPDDGKVCLEDMMALRLHTKAEPVLEIVAIAVNEQKIEKKMEEIESAWRGFQLEFVPHKSTDMRVVKVSDDIMDTLSAHQMDLQNVIAMGKTMEFFRARVELSAKNLGTVEEVLKDWLSVTKSWGALESIFLASADIRAQLPDDTKRFEGIDAAFKELMKAAVETPNAVEACIKEGRGEALKEMIRNLELCQKSLNDYLDTKKKIFPRFYFVSNTALLDILSNGNNPPKVVPYLGDCFDSIADLDFEPYEAPAVPTTAFSMIAKDGEKVRLHEPFIMKGAVERWLNQLNDTQQETLKRILETALESAVNWETAPEPADDGAEPDEDEEKEPAEEEEKPAAEGEGAEKPAAAEGAPAAPGAPPPVTASAGSAAAAAGGSASPVAHPDSDEPKPLPRHRWLDKLPAQIVLVGSQIYWTEETQTALDELEAGQEDAVKKYLVLCKKRLKKLIDRVLGRLSDPMRTKIIALITLDVHARDTVQKLIDTKAEGPSSFMWSQQLRFYWQPENRDVNIAITDFRSKYSYEYLGNSGRLVITPLTDRCYITLTLALRLFLGGAPAGPAGTGKTETTKDLARALALPCYVFNCSDQMNYQTMAEIFKGLSQTGAWGCFDEFNRINIEVLSVVATQVKCILDAAVMFAVPANREPQYQSAPAGTPPVVVGSFELNGDIVTLVPTVGMFITMNPGYAGRTELPENLKALFRSCAMVKPDLALICENMLMSEGFQEARPLAIKFVTLYELSSELLSPQAHYDWGLRSVKSVLRVAGGLKRADPTIAEDGVLMRALRDFNTPKMPLSDLPIFLRLIQDLFPKSYTLPTKLNVKVQEAAIIACKKTGLQADPVFVAKVVQLQDLMDVRHSVMLLGPGGCGKTTVWKTLAEAHNLKKDARDPKAKNPCHYDVVDPKSVTGDELYGYMTLAKQWKDGCLSIIMRGMSKNLKEQGYGPHQTHKWVVLDGDIDAVWIESMNTVMDDNKMLTLVSNERIPLSRAMRMVFEINSLANATPATVSRAGILYINESDIGWKPYVETWLANLMKGESEGEGSTLAMMKAHLPGLFDKYVDKLTDALKGGKTGTPIQLITQVVTICRLLEGFLPTVPKETRRPLLEVLESHFFIAAAWAFGGALVEGRAGFHKALVDASAGAVRIVKELEEYQVFDLFFNPETEEMERWATMVPAYVHPEKGVGPDGEPFASLVVPTVDTVRLLSLTGQLIKRRHPVMFVGTAGTGKTILVKTFLSEGVKDPFIANTITMNYYMDSAALQARIDSLIDKRTGRKYGPIHNKKLVLFVDDLNLPYIETYGTQNSLSLLRQIIDHEQYYDRADLGFRKEIQDLYFITAMNPTAGSFSVTERLQRNFSTFACVMPSDSDLTRIFKSILDGHLVGSGFTPEVCKVSDAITAASIALHKHMSSKFLPDAERFMYNWNMRELANIFQGLCLAKENIYKEPVVMARLWLHEAQRVYKDRLVDEANRKSFDATIGTLCAQCFREGIQQARLLEEPLVFTNWVGQTSEEPSYIQIDPTAGRGAAKLSATAEEKLESYNSAKPVMNLVLFDAAVEHVCRIVRILSTPGGHALLVGVGGSGKQSLCRLATHIVPYPPDKEEYRVIQLPITSNYTIQEFKDQLKAMFALAGRGFGVVFLLTDSQIVNEKFLVFVNDILSSGWIADLFERDELQPLLDGVRNEAKAKIDVEAPGELFRFYRERVKANLHVVLCFSPVGAAFRVRARRFPGLVNCTVIDKFHAWPRDALVRVAMFQLPAALGPPELIQRVAEHMADVHLSVTRVSDDFKDKMRRYNYVTPKSFLELIKFYMGLLAEKRSEVEKNIDRLQKGLSVIANTTAMVADLKIDTARAVAKAEQEVAATNILVAEMAKQTAEATVKKAEADAVAQDAARVAESAAIIKAEAVAAVEAAQPLVARALAALGTVKKPDLDTLKALPNLSEKLVPVMGACGQMLKGDHKKYEVWANVKKDLLNDSNGFLQKLIKYGTEDVKVMDRGTYDVLEMYCSDKDFTGEAKKTVAGCAAGLTDFVVAVRDYRRVLDDVQPKEAAKARAEVEESVANGKRDEALRIVAELDANLAALQKTFEEANARKQAAEELAAEKSGMLDMANRLVNGLASENERWTIEVAKLRTQSAQLTGDALLGAAFVSYAGAFNAAYRRRLWEKEWMPDLVAKKIPLSDGIDPLVMLTDEERTARMQSEGLPADRISLENGAIITSSKRWPLLIDPQMQGIKWLKRREEPNRVAIVQLSQPRWVEAVKSALTNGTPIIIENVGEELDATLDPVLARAVAPKLRARVLQLGGSEVECKMAATGDAPTLDPEAKPEEQLEMRLYLQTKLSNPHYRPEIQAQCTIVNFIATEAGLQDQLLARVVNEEKAELERQKQELQAKFNEYKLQLLALENNLLYRLEKADPDPNKLLKDVDLVTGLEATKKASVVIAAAVAKGRTTEAEINLARQVYVPVAEEGAMLYFLITSLSNISHMYQYSLDAFLLYFGKAIREAPRFSADDIKSRVAALKETLRIVIYTWVSRGLSEADKLILMSQLTFQLMARKKLADAEEFSPVAFRFLLQGPSKSVTELPPGMEWLPKMAWERLLALADLEGGEFAKLPADIVEAPARFKEWFNHVTPELEKLPLDWAGLDKTPFKKLLVLRCMRPDRVQVALKNFVAATLPAGSKFVECDSTLNSMGVLADALRDATPATPTYFILSPGADVVADVDKLAAAAELKKGISYHNVSMGQGQDKVAMEKLELGHKEGFWVILNNVHLMPRWLVELEKKMDLFAVEGSHERFRVFLTSDPANSIPIGLLNRSIKLTNEPPQGLKANLKRSFCIFPPDMINDLDTKLRAIVFGLSYFHAAMIERKKFGSMGYNMMYPFALGDLRDSVVCLQNYMENATGRVPWEDLRYIFGEIMYGGHIVNNLDRLICNTYLDCILRDELLEEHELVPFADKADKLSFKTPNPTTADRYLEHIEAELKESPAMIGLHPNAAIATATDASEALLRTLQELQPRDGGAAGEGGMSPQAQVKTTIGDILDAMSGASWNVEAMPTEEVTPHSTVLTLELKAMDRLRNTIRAQTKNLLLGIDGLMTMSEAMEKLFEELLLSRVPGAWAKVAWPSMRGLGTWKEDLRSRIMQLAEWSASPTEVPRVMTLGWLFNPQSFLTAVRQVTAQNLKLELDRLAIQTEVTKRNAEEIDASSRDGAYICGLAIVGATYDVAAGQVEKSKPRQMFTPMPVMNVKAISVEKVDDKGVYNCPVYKTSMRGPTYVFTAQLKTKSPPGRWILAGVCLLMDTA